MKRPRGHRKRLFLISAATGALVAVGWFWATGRIGPGRPPNVILVSIDTCRADYLGCYGYPRPTTPNVDTFAREAVLFSNVITPVPSTLPAHCSMLTGTNPPYHGVHANIEYRLRESDVSLAEILGESGYHTAAVIGSYSLHSKSGIAQGFDFYEEDFRTPSAVVSTDNERKAEEVNKSAIDWLENKRREPFFLFVHYFDPHFPYEPPQPYSSTFADNLYAGEIAYVDHCLGQLFAKLKELDQYDPSLIIVASDHGEDLGDHGEQGHGYFIYHSTTKVPLIVKPPHNRRGSEINDLVGLIDIVPTVLHYAGLPAPKAVQGQDLSPLLAGKKSTVEQRHLYSESLAPTVYGCCSLLGMENLRWKYIQTTRPELYDVPQDPAQRADVIDQHPQEAAALREALRTTLIAQTRLFDEEPSQGVAQETPARLGAMGYMGGKIQEDFSFEVDKEDPKDFVEFYVQVSAANRMFRAGRFDEAKQACMSILAKRRDIAKVHELLGRLAFREGDFDTAGDELSEALRLDPNDAVNHDRLGEVRSRQGRTEEAIGLFRKALQLAGGTAGEKDTLDRALVQLREVDSVLFAARLNLADALFELGRYEEAVAQYHELSKIEALPGNRETFERMRAQAYYRLGVALSASGKQEQAMEAFNQALTIRPDFAEARQALESAGHMQSNTNPS